MSSKNTLSAQDETRTTEADDRDHEDREGNNHSVAQKLSSELDTWRRQRNGSKPNRLENSASNGSNSQSSGPARTIRVRGHETLVVRRPKLPPKPESDSARDKG